MARRNPDKAKELIQRYTRQITNYGDEGKSELRELFVGDRRPDVILALPQGPDRQARAAQLIGELREIAQELAEAQAARESVPEPRSSKKAKKTEPKKKKEKPSDIVWKTTGRIDGFSYVIGRRRDGDFVAKINHKGRNIIEDDKAPKIYENEVLKKTFRDQDGAELAVRRVVNTAMIWYEQRGIRPREKARRSQRAKSGVRRRTASHREAISREEEEGRRIDARKKAAQERADRIREEKTRRSNPERSLRHIPRANPSSLFSFKHSETAAEKQAAKSFESYLKFQGEWDESLKSGKPRFMMVMKAYDALENSRANFVLAGQQERADKVDKVRADLRQQIVDIFVSCSRELSGTDEPQRNPTAETHEKIAEELLEKANSWMGKYESTGSVSSLLNAYSHYEMAKREFGYAKNKSGLKEASSGAKKARGELKKARV